MINLTSQFFKNGWLLIAFFPIIQLIQRTPLTIIAILYLLWAIWSLTRTSLKFSFQSRLLWLYSGVIVSFSLSIWGANDSSLGLSKWLQFFAYSAIFPVIWLTLQHNKIKRLSHFLAIGACLSLIILFIKLIYFYWFTDHFDPRYQMNENILPLLMPFVLYWGLVIQTRFARVPFTLMLYSIMLFYVIISQGRAILLAYIIASFLFAVFVLSWRLHKVFLGMLGLFIISIAFSGTAFFRGLSLEGSIADNIDRFTSNRSIIWRQAIQNPPKNIWTGYGMGHVKDHAEILQVTVNGITDQYKHLHMFILDVFYETGIIGLISLLLFILSVLLATLKCWRYSPPLTQQQLGLYFTASCAILIAASLDLAYDSKEFNVYLFMLLGVLAHLVQRPRTI